MSDNFKHIENHFKESVKGYELAGSTDSFTKIMAATNKKLFFKFIPKRFNVFYLSAAIVATSTTIPVIINSNSVEKPKVEETIVIKDTVDVTEKTAIYTDSLDTLNENRELSSAVKVSSETKEMKELSEADTFNITPPKNPVASTSKEIIPETIEEDVIEEELLDKPGTEVSEEFKPIENQINITDDITTTNTKAQRVDSVVVIEKDNVLIKKSELKVKKQTVKKKGR